MKIALIMALSVMIVLIIITATLIKNQARLFESPGLIERLSIYLRQHTAATSDNHSFPELRTPVFEVGAERLFDVVMESAKDLGWRIKEHDNQSLNAALVITTPVFRFSDDLVVQVVSTSSQDNAEKSVLNIHSRSRIGRADFAANAGHIQTLVMQVRQKTKRREQGLVR